MTINRKLATFALAAGIGAMNLVTLGSAAMADEHGHFDRGRGREIHYGHPAPHFAYRDEHRDHDRHHGDIGKGLAIGLGALVLGSVIAAEANRHHRDYD